MRIKLILYWASLTALLWLVHIADTYNTRQSCLLRVGGVNKLLDWLLTVARRPIGKVRVKVNKLSHNATVQCHSCDRLTGMGGGSSIHAGH